MTFSERAAKAAGLEAQQYKALLAIRAHVGEEPMSTTELAEALLIGVSSAVELVNRLQMADLVVRQQSRLDRRKTLLGLTPRAERIMKTLAGSHREEIGRHLPVLKSPLSQSRPAKLTTGEGQKAEACERRFTSESEVDAARSDW
jgi:DNA-binding MarR family transcriptional regulator